MNMLVDAETPIRVSQQVAEQLEKLRDLGDRQALRLFLEAIEATRPTTRKERSRR